jgi:formimidoylglutamate deiminase
VKRDCAESVTIRPQVDETGFPLPGFVSAHSHAFQRALRGRGAGGDFWAWRESMLAEAERQTPDGVRRSYEAVYRELRGAGYTAVGEFHYLGFAEALAAVEAARAAEIEIVLLLAAYERGGIERFRQESVAEYLGQVERLRDSGAHVGLAPHSVRACSAAWLVDIGRHAAREGLVLHVHADEQPREIEDCLAEHGVRPVELLARTGCLTPATTIVHATHADERELDLVADAGATVCLCPTTEANLGDGFPPLDGLLERGIRLAIGSDSNVRIDPLEELRELEGTARRQMGRREVIPLPRLLALGSSGGASALGLERWPDACADLAHPSLAGVAREDVPAALVFSCSADVFCG